MDETDCHGCRVINDYCTALLKHYTRYMEKTRRALITGITGQDGSYLAPFLLDRGYEVFGLVRRSSIDPFIRIENLRLQRKIKIIYGDLRDEAAVDRAIGESEPDEIYNLASQSDVRMSYKIPEETFEINYNGAGRLVNRAMAQNPNVHIYQASSCEMFGNSESPHNENTKFQPVSPYATAKFMAHKEYVEEYRKRYQLYICSGFLFNHESPVRGKNFVTRKITHSLAKIKLGQQKTLELGNLNARRDWGFSGDYVEAMWKILQQNKPEDYVIATGKSHSVREFVSVAGRVLDINLEWSGSGLQEVGRNRRTGNIVVRVNKEFYKKTDIKHRYGDIEKARKYLDWKPRTRFAELISMMVKSDLGKLSKENQ